VGDAALGEWREMGDQAFHVRRRLASAEECQTGPVADIRRTPEARLRAAMVGRMLVYAPPDVLADEVGPDPPQWPL